MEALLQFLVAISILAITGLGTWLWRVHSKTHENEVRVLNLRNEFAEKYMSKEVERRIFEKLEQLSDALANLREEVRVALAKRGRKNE